DLHVEPIGARVETPVDRPRIVAERVAPVVGELEAGAASWREMDALSLAEEPPPRAQSQRLELVQEVLRERRRGAHGRRRPRTTSPINAAAATPSASAWKFRISLCRSDGSTASAMSS